LGVLDDLYARRFKDPERYAKDRVWAEIGKHLQRYVDPEAPVLDIACDDGYFTRNIHASEKWACDMRDVSGSLPSDTHFVQSDGLELATRLPSAHFGTVFMSNYLEHLPSGDLVVQQFRVAQQLLRPGGKVVVLQPNIRLTGGSYWDFIDHKVALTDRSLVEAAEAASLQTERVVVRFLPYTTKGKLPMHPWLVRMYLRFPPAWRILGQQTLYVGRRS
jgi:2-polyprenyl-3-methyl-5-hydroxy-6-metoxy-1,4-benzoquinol methylase